MTSLLQLRKVQAGRDYIASNINEPFSLAGAAVCANMSPYHFCRTFKKAYGETPNEFLVKLRINKAKQLLVTENYSISDICDQVGYQSLGSFSSLFQKHVGIAPTQFRKKIWALSSQAFHYPIHVIPSCYSFRLTQCLSN